MQNYPNPFNPTTVINYSIPNVGTPLLVLLKVYDVLGNEVAVLVNEKQQSGSYSIKFDASKFASGMYIAKLYAGNFTKIIKMNLVK